MRASSKPQPIALRKTRTSSARAAVRAQKPDITTANLRDEVVAYRKDLILQAAQEAFFEHGYHACTVDMIAQRLSGSKAIVYHYFPDKRSMLQEIYQRALKEAQDLMRKAILQNESPIERLAAIARSYTEWVIENQKLVAVYWREVQSLSSDGRAAVAVEQKKMDDLLAGTIRDGVSKGQLDVMDVQTTARAIEGMITFIYTWWRDDKRMSRAAAVDHYAQLTLRIVGVKAG